MIKDIVARLYPLHRTIVCDEFDKALDVIGAYLPKAVNYQIEEYATGKVQWTWQVPKRYHVREAYLEIEGGEKVADFNANPLHLVSFSQPIDKVMDWNELAPHLYFSPKRPNAVPWIFKYYEQTWGFCISKYAYEALPRDRKYRVLIRSEFRDHPGLRLGVGVVHPINGPTTEMGEILVSAHTCHPHQANDNASGVAVAVTVAQRLVAKPLPPGSASVRFLFQPETVGTVCYLSAHEDLIANLRSAVVCECLGNVNNLAVQHSWRGNGTIDRIADHVLKKSGSTYRSLPAWHIFSADEKVLEGPGVSIPSIMLTRAPFDEYHTTDDNVGIIDEGMLEEAAAIIENIVRVAATDYIPLRKFRGPVQLSRYGLWVPYETDRPQSLAMQQAMRHFEGRLSVFEIAGNLGVDYWRMREIVEGYRNRGLVEPFARSSLAPTPCG